MKRALARGGLPQGMVMQVSQEAHAHLAPFDQRGTRQKPGTPNPWIKEITYLLMTSK